MSNECFRDVSPKFSLRRATKYSLCSRSSSALACSAGGEEYSRLALRPVEQQRRVHVAGVAAVGARQVVQRAGADAFQQVGALDGIHDQPELGVEVMAARGAGQGKGFGVGVGHGRK